MVTLVAFESASSMSDSHCQPGRHLIDGKRSAWQGTSDSALVLISVRCRLRLGHEAGAVLGLDGVAFAWQPGQLVVGKTSVAST
jgi:hypothetical protein